MSHIERIEKELSDNKQERILMNARDVKLLLMEARTWADYVKRQAVLDRDNLFNF